MASAAVPHFQRPLSKVIIKKMPKPKRMQRILEIIRPDRGDKIQIWLNPNLEVVVSRMKGGELLPLTAKIHEIREDRDPPVITKQVESKASIVIG